MRECNSTLGRTGTKHDARGLRKEDRPDGFQNSRHGEKIHAIATGREHRCSGWAGLHRRRATACWLRKRGVNADAGSEFIAPSSQHPSHMPLHLERPGGAETVARQQPWSNREPPMSGVLGSKPRIWRRLSLPGDLTLDVVHTLFQAAMGWTDSHLHRFQPGIGQGYNQPYFVTEFDEDEGEEGIREDGVRLDQVLRAPGDRLTYLYDFGDGWEHRVTLESPDPLTPGDREPVCLGGARACPPEDVGGIHAHHDIAAWLRAGAPAEDVPEPFEDAEHAHGWLPVDYDPDAFDAAAATAAMRLWASGEHLPWYGIPEPLADLVQRLRGQGWVQAL